jgi:arginine exporter protein ArgO
MFGLLLDQPLLRGMIIGALMAMPVGAVGMMCIRRALDRQRWRAMAVGLGSATCDGFFGFVAGAGVTALGSFIIANEIAIALIGGVVVVAMGVLTYRAAPPPNVDDSLATGLGGDFGKAFTLSVLNPATFLGAVALNATIGGGVEGHLIELTAGVVLGSIAWWLFLTALTTLLRERFVGGTLPHLNHVEGMVVTGFGLALMAAAMIKFTV